MAKGRESDRRSGGAQPQAQSPETNIFLFKVVVRSRSFPGRVAGWRLILQAARAGGARRAALLRGSLLLRYSNTKYCPAQPRAMGCGLFWGLTPVATHAHADAPDYRSRSHLRGPISTKPSQRSRALHRRGRRCAKPCAHMHLGSADSCMLQMPQMPTVRPC